MKKIRCPHCEVINLEGFITFPYCAGCGMRLPESAFPGKVPAWRRPLGPVLWTSIVGCIVVGLVVMATNFFELMPQDPTRVVVFGRTSQSTRVGNRVSLQLRLDAMDTRMRREDEPLRGISLRLPREFFTAFELVSVEPSPDAITVLGGGQYYSYKSLPRDTRLRLVLRALRPGEHRLVAQIYVQNQFQDDYHVKLDVAPTAKTEG